MGRFRTDNAIDRLGAITWGYGFLVFDGPRARSTRSAGGPQLAADLPQRGDFFPVPAGQRPNCRPRLPVPLALAHCGWRGPAWTGPWWTMDALPAGAAEFVLALEQHSPEGGPPPTRRGAFYGAGRRSRAVSARQLGGAIHVDRARHVWQCAAGGWGRDPVCRS